MRSQHFELLHQHLILHPLRAIFWQEASLLLLADLHLGKVTHFRKGGLPVPAQASSKNWDNLQRLFDEFVPPRVMFLGDLFHSTHNAEWEQFLQFLEKFPETSFELVPGNHDILPPEHYQHSCLKLLDSSFHEAPFIFSHEPLESWPNECYNLAGHLHPAVQLRGQGQQYLKLPCFYFGQKQGILPAFGVFTGTAILKPKAGDKIFALTEDAVVQASN